jgi:hypothetical protein
LLSSVIYIAGYDAAPKSVPPFQMKEILGDYDAIHVRRGDLLKNRKDRFDIERSLHPHLDRDTRPEYIIKRIAQWIPPGRTYSLHQMKELQASFPLCQTGTICTIFSFLCPTRISGVI